MESHRGRTKVQMGGGRAVERQASDGEKAVEVGGAVYRLNTK